VDAGVGRPRARLPGRRRAAELRRVGAPLSGTRPDAAGKPFVIEADEYDTAFFDKRSKFVHYRPRTAILNNLEFDHADIFADLAAIETQFHHLVRTVPASGRLVVNARDEALQRVLARGCWTPVQRFGTRGEEPGGLRARGEPHAFDVLRGSLKIARVDWALLGEHNQLNALAAIAAAEHVGVAPATAAAALADFHNVRRRLELRGEARGVKVYDDFAHHPTAMRSTLDGLRRKVGVQRILAVFEPRSNTMKLGAMKAQLPWALEEADLSFCLQGDYGWSAREALAPLGERAVVADTWSGWWPRSRGRQPRRPRAVHEQRRLRRHPRQAARGAAGASLMAAAATDPPGHGDSRHAPAVPARLSLVAAVVQGAAAARLAGGAPARRALVVPAAAALAKRGLALLRDGCAGWPAHASAVLGSSLGGFYATVVAERLRLAGGADEPGGGPGARPGATSARSAPITPAGAASSFAPNTWNELRAMSPPAITRPERYFAIIAKGDELLDWREMLARYRGARIRLLEGSDHA
jgi:predicted esterase YcpF (UPF0227 family)